MGRATPIVVLMVACCGATPVMTQDARPPQSGPGNTTHGIIRKAQPKTAEPVKVAPAASTEAVAAAIAAAVRSAEETKKPTPAVRPRVARPSAAPAVAQRRYTVSWPSQRFEVHWETADEGAGRVSLSWSTPGSSNAYGQGGRALEP